MKSRSGHSLFSGTGPSPQPLYIRNYAIVRLQCCWGAWQHDNPLGINNPWESILRHAPFSMNPNSCLGHGEPALAREGEENEFIRDLHDWDRCQ